MNPEVTIDISDSKDIALIRIKTESGELTNDAIAGILISIAESISFEKQG